MSLPDELRPTLGALRRITLDPDAPDFTARQLAVLMAVADKVEKTMLGVRELHVQLGMSKPAVTRACSRLETAGFLVRKSDPVDRRLVNLSISSAGTAYLKKMAKGVSNGSLQKAA